MNTIGIIIPTYNSSKYIIRCLDSLLKQSFKDVQIIIVNDCSTDNTLQIIKSYEPLFIKEEYSFHIISLDKNQGQAACFNYGFELLDSKYFTWLDSDDFLYPNCFMEKVYFMEKHNDIDLCICKGHLFDEYDLNNPIAVIERNSNNDYFEDVVKMNDVIWTPGSIFVKTSFMFERLKNRSIFPSRQGQNIQLLLPLLYKAKYLYLDKVLFGIVSHIDSHSRKRYSYREMIIKERQINTIYRKTLENIDMSFLSLMKWMRVSKQTKRYRIYNYAKTMNRGFFVVLWHFLFISFVHKVCETKKLIKKISA